MNNVWSDTESTQSFGGRPPLTGQPELLLDLRLREPIAGEDGAGGGVTTSIINRFGNKPNPKAMRSLNNPFHKKPPPMQTFENIQTDNHL